MDYIFASHSVKLPKNGFGVAYSFKAENHPGVDLLWSVCTELKEVSDLARCIAHTAK